MQIQKNRTHARYPPHNAPTLSLCVHGTQGPLLTLVSRRYAATQSLHATDSGSRFSAHRFVLFLKNSELVPKQIPSSTHSYMRKPRNVLYSAMISSGSSSNSSLSFLLVDRVARPDCSSSSILLVEGVLEISSLSPLVGFCHLSCENSA